MNAVFVAICFSAALFLQTSAIPAEISLNYGSSGDQMVVTWSASSNSDIVVQFGSSAEDLSLTATSTVTSYTYQTYTSPFLYKAILSGLQVGNKVYYYRVGSTSEGYSDVFSFKTNPGVGVPGVTFHLLGDVGQTTDNSVNTMKEIVDSENSLTGPSGGIVSMGDLSYANGDQPLWDTFMNLKQFMSTQIPMFTTVGNHEWFDFNSYNFTSFYARFDSPLVDEKRELYYSFDAGLVHWVMVAGYCPEMKSTSTQPCLAAGTPQLAWLQANLAGVDRSVTPWVFVAFHEPYINSNTAHSIQAEGLPMQAAIEDTLFNAKVDVVFSGHVHAYERSCQVYKYKCTDGAPYYITIGDGGNAEGLASGWVEPQPDWSVFRQASYGYGELNVVNSSHTFWQWHQNSDLSPVIADEFWFVKGDTSVNDAKSHPRLSKAPVFASTERGRKGSLFNEAVTKEQKPRLL